MLVSARTKLSPVLRNNPGYLVSLPHVDLDQPAIIDNNRMLPSFFGVISTGNAHSDFRGSMTSLYSMFSLSVFSNLRCKRPAQYWSL